MLKIGDIVKMNKTYPIWLLSVGLTVQDVGVILDIVLGGMLQLWPDRMISVYRNTQEKAFYLKPRTLVKATKH